MHRTDNPYEKVLRPSARRRPVCRECDGCRQYLATVDSNGTRYCADCGHVESRHP